MKNYLLLILALFMGCMAFAQQTYTPTKENLAARVQFQDMKFGMFIHWGASSVLANGEWVMNNRGIRAEDYKLLQNVFNPTEFNAKEWVSIAKNAGMQYITLITRHHDGFSNFDTKESDWKITNTLYGKDIVKQIADECHRQGIKICFYYSLLDWYRTDYQWETGKTGKKSGRTAKSNWDSYIKFMKAQLTELLTNYGEISAIWFDGHWDQLDNDLDKSLQSKVNWHYEEIYPLIHKLQPQCLIGNNHHLLPIAGEDFQMFEKDLPGSNTTGFGGADISQLPLETCETMNDAWGYNITDRNFKSSKAIIHYLVNAAGRNANFLLNVGPKPNGVIQKEFTDTLALVGKWMAVNSASIQGTRGNIVAAQDWGVLTQKNKTIYIHLLSKKDGNNYIFIPQLNEKITTANLFNTKTPVKFKQVAEGVFVYLDSIQLNDIDTIIQLN
ncbi:MAG: alpha-L-fucosidase [Bacteroidota bacterium]